MRSDQLVTRAVARAKDGDLSALHFLYVRYVDDVAERVRSVGGEPQAVDDVTQEVFAGLVETIGEHQTGEVAFEAWILRAARSAAIGSRETAEEDGVGNPEPAAAAREAG
jgi:DNA-directed RNA polymerase specialized sigma24 family protein